MNKNLLGIGIILSLIAFLTLHTATVQHCSTEQWFQREFHASPSAVQAFTLLTSNYSITCRSNRCAMKLCSDHLNCCMISNTPDVQQSLSQLTSASDYSRSQMLQYAACVSTNLSKIDGVRFLSWFSQQTRLDK